MPVDPATLVVALVITFLAAIVQGTIGIGLGLLSVPVLTLIDPVLTPVPQLIATLPMTMMMSGGEAHAIEWRAVGRVVAARVPGIAIGIGLLAIADDHLLDGLIGASVLLAVIIIASGVTIHRNRTSELVAGVVSGATATISSIGGPPLALLYRRESGSAVRANLATIFFFGILMTVAARAFSGHVSSTDLWVSLWLAPVVVAGYLVARRLHAKMEGRALRASILAVSALSGAGLLVRSLLS